MRGCTSITPASVLRREAEGLRDGAIRFRKDAHKMVERAQEALTKAAAADMEAALFERAAATLEAS